MTDRFARFKRFFEDTGSTVGTGSGDARDFLLVKDFMRFDLTGSARFYAR